MIFETIFLGRSETLPYVWKTMSQKWKAFAFGSTYLDQTFTECIYMFWYINIPELTASYGIFLWFYCVFWSFSYIIIDHSCLNCCISTKLSRIMHLINTHILICWYARCNYKLLELVWFNKFFENFNVWYVLLSSSFHKKLWKVYENNCV